MPEYFYDTYALTEYVNSNRNYKKYFEGANGVTSRLNLMELYYALLRDAGREKADIAYDSLLPIAMEASDAVIKKAMELRLELKRAKKSVSYTDAVGYQLALALKIRFLTGDKEFRGMENVEFVK